MPIDYSQITWQEFERLCCDVLYREGYRDIQPVGRSHEEGADALEAHANRGRGLSVWQWRRWTAEYPDSKITGAVDEEVRKLAGSGRVSLGADEVRLTKEKLGLPSEMDFYVPAEVADQLMAVKAKLDATRNDWDTRFFHSFFRLDLVTHKSDNFGFSTYELYTRIFTCLRKIRILS